jgi:cholesterol transport system auxiliary component
MALYGCAAFAAAGCTGSLFQSKAAPPSIYLLSAKLEPAPAAPAPAPGPAVSVAPKAIPADLAILRPRVRAGLETDRIAVLYPDRRLEYFADARWSGPLDELVQDLALQAFDTGAGLRNVSADASAFASGYWLELEVADFQAEYASSGAAPTIHVHFLARLGGAGDRRILATFDAGARETATDNRLTAIVDAYERAADAALADIVAHTVRTLSEEGGRAH